MSGPAERREPEQLNNVPLPEERTDLVGHDATRAKILTSLSAGRLPSAILLHGPQGIGKATLAFALAREILARTGGETPERTAEQVAAGSHPNLFVLRRQPKDAKGFYTVIRIDDVRELRERMRKTRGRSGHRVAIVDAIDDCNPSAANALLKTLEEPPADTLFLLISHRPGQLLPTIKSRCQNLALRPLGDAEVQQVLTSSAAVVAPAALDQAVALAAGRPRRGFEALAIGADSGLAALRNWLAAPTRFPAAAHLELADVLLADPAGAEALFARDTVLDWLAGEAKTAALQGLEGRMRLASANELWEKAQAQFAEADSLNLDPRQTLVGIFDAIRRHVQTTTPASIEP